MAFVRFAKKLCLFLVLLAALLTGLELLARRMFPPTPTMHKLRTLQAAAAGAEVAIFGTSHMYLGVNPAYLRWPGFNFADTAQDLYYGGLLFLRNLERMPKLNVVVIGLDPFSFGFDEAVVNTDGVLDYLAFGYPPRRPVYLIQRIQSASVLARYRTVFLKNLPLFLRGRLHETPATDQDAPPAGFTGPHLLLHNGCLYSQGTETEEFMTAYGPGQARMHLSMYSPALRGDNLNILRRWIDTALQRDCRVLLVTPPTYVRYYEHLDPTMTAQFRADVHALVEGYAGDPRVQYRSYWPDPTFPRQEFFDGDHLNVKGSRHFTKILNRDITALLAADPPSGTPHQRDSTLAADPPGGTPQQRDNTSASTRNPGATVRNSGAMTPEARPRP